ncbi:MAG: diguanylate cyclase [Rhodocyclaceae bacterium]
MPYPIFERLESRLIGTVGVALLVFSVIVGMLTYTYEYQHEFRLAESLQQQLVRTVQEQAEVAAFASNAEIARGVLSGLFANPVILAARIESLAGFEADLGYREKVSLGTSRDYPLISPADHLEQIGTLTVVQNDSWVRGNAIQAAVLQTVLMLLQVLIVVLIVAAVLRRMMIHPITRLAKEMAAIQPGSSVRLQVDEQHAADEIGLLSNSANLLLQASAEAIAALKQQNALLSSLLKNLPVGVVMVESPSGKLLMSNEIAAKLLGRGILPDAARSGFAEVFPAYRVGSRAPYPVEEMPLILGMKGVASHVDDMGVQRPDGGETILEVFGSPVTDEDGDVWASLVSFIDITERKAMEEQIRQLAFHDVLTQLPNRRLLNDRLRQTQAAGKRSGCYGALMFLDLDDFKPLNDTYGHEVGDRLLIEVADRLKACVRDMDTVARFGGDEFVVVIGDLDADRAESVAQAAVIAEKIRLALCAPYRLMIRHKDESAVRIEHRCTVSIGVALFFSDDASQDEILKWADAAMYQAKDAGRNSIRFYRPDA